MISGHLGTAGIIEPEQLGDGDVDVDGGASISLKDEAGPQKMKTKSTRIKKSNPGGRSSGGIYGYPKAVVASVLVFADAILVALIIAFVPYTKIDWDAYMSQVDGFLEGEKDYGNLKGDTGPLVYPAGFLYVYAAIRYITGGEVYPAQILFGFLYVINLAITMFVYVKTDVIEHALLLGYSIFDSASSMGSNLALFVKESAFNIFLLLFNDCIATMLLQTALVALLYQKWNLGLIIFSGAVSIKMNVLLYASSLLLLLLKAMDVFGVITALACAAVVQIVLGLPFLFVKPLEYLSRAFNLGRVFIHFWSVNFKFVPEPLFTSKGFAVSLLIAHLSLLTLFAHYRWCKHEGGLLSFLHSKILSLKMRLSFTSSSSVRTISKEHIVTTMLVGNFIGILCARSLHYQFYSWYFYSLPYLLWKSPFPTVLRVALFFGVELCWNIYPSNVYSSVLLLFLHLVILLGIWCAPPEHPYTENKPETKDR